MHGTHASVDNPVFPPGWAIQRLLPDHLYARAYADVSDERQAELKQLTAALYPLYAGWRRKAQVVEWQSDAGFRLRVTSTPKPGACLILGSGVQSPSAARVIAALLPGACCGTAQLTVAGMSLRERLLPDVLYGIELSGTSEAYDLGPRQLEWFVSASADAGHALICLDPGPAERRLFGVENRCVVLQSPRSIGVLAGGEEEVNLEAVRRVHPESELRRIEGGAFLPEDDLPAVLYGESNDERATISPEVRIGVGREWFWCWPELHAGHFLQTTFHATGKRTPG